MPVADNRTHEPIDVIVEFQKIRARLSVVEEAVTQLVESLEPENPMDEAYYEGRDEWVQRARRRGRA